MTANGLLCGQMRIATKAQGRFLPNQRLSNRELRAKAAKVALLLTEGKNAEAVLLASFVDWQSGASADKERHLHKANYDPSEPRDEEGRWSSTGAHTFRPTTQGPSVIPIASADDPRGNKMAKDAANAAGLNRAQRRQLHDLITGQGITDYQTILQIAKDIASGGA